MGDVRTEADEAAVVLYARKLAAREEHSYCKGRNELKSEIVRFKKRSQTHSSHTTSNPSPVGFWPRKAPRASSHCIWQFLPS